ncbi:MAG: capsule biosynthesis protein [Primorskyibacter sp.]
MTKKHARRTRKAPPDAAPLSGIQIRAARRMAQKHGIAAASDTDMLRQLRARGIDPFERTVQLELVQAPPRPQSDGAPVIQHVSPSPSMAPTPLTPAEARAAEIATIQADMARARRKRIRRLVLRLLVFVVLPGVLAGIYYTRIATPLYATQAEFLILKNDGAGAAAGLLSGTQFATNQDAIAVQSYLMSREAMQRLDSDHGFQTHFAQATDDPVLTWRRGTTIEDAHALYKRMVKIGFDPSEGVLRMEVRAIDPGTATTFAKALIDYAETRVDHLSQRKRNVALQEAKVGLAEAETARHKAQRALVTLQHATALADPAGRIVSLRGQINGLEVQLQDKKLRLAALQDNRRPPAARIAAAQGDVARIDDLLAQLRTEMVSATDGALSLAEIAVEVQLAEADLATRDLMLQAAIDRLDSARRNADAQARYLTVSVDPTPPDAAAYPRAFQDTALVVLVAAGIYLMMSLTASILREQVSA